MLKYVKSIISKLLNFFGYDLVHKKTIDNSDDPFEILRKIVDCNAIKIIVDAGASIGDTSEKFSSYFTQATVYAFEPYPPFLSILVEKAEKNKNIIVEPFAIGKKCEKNFLNVNNCEDTNSLFEPREETFNVYGPLLSKSGKIEVEIKTIDLWSKEKNVQEIDILKLDLQGGELDALKGAKELFSSARIKIVLCEVMFNKCYKNQSNWTEVVSYIENFNLQLFNIYQPFFQHGRLIQADLIFIAKEFLFENEFSDNFHAYSKLLK